MVDEKRPEGVFCLYKEVADKIERVADIFKKSLIK